MNNSFQIEALDQGLFSRLFELTDEELAKIHAVRMIADEKPGFPCRVSLEDADPGEETLLITFDNHDVSSPYKSSGPIFVRKQAKTARPAPNEIPHMLIHRMLSLRGFDKNAMMLEASTIHGTELRYTIQHFFENPNVDYIHIHNSGPGCYNCSVVRACES